MATIIQDHNSNLVELIVRLEQLLSDLDFRNLQTAAIHVDAAICELCEIAQIERPKSTTNA